MENTKLRARRLLERREELEQDARQHDEGGGVYDEYSPANYWLDDMVENTKQLLRVYVCYVAPLDWLYLQIAEDIPHALNSFEGEAQFIEELTKWAQLQRV